MANNYDIDPYRHLAVSDEFWFPEGMDRDDTLGQSVTDETAIAEDVTYEIRAYIDEDGRWVVDYFDIED